MVLVVFSVYGAKEANDLSNWRINNQAVFITNENNVRSSPDVKSSLVDVPPKGTNCEILDQKDRWFKVRFGSKTGWTNRININLVNNRHNKIEEKKGNIEYNRSNEAVEKEENVISESQNEIIFIKELNMEFIKCPAGSFMMGSPEEEHFFLKEKMIEHKKNFFEYNEKRHLVTITKPFYIGKYEVTQSQYLAVKGKNPSKYVDANNPVERVGHTDAFDFTLALAIKYSKYLPKGYRFALPTEAQWEYACRAGTNTALNNGKNITKPQGYCTNLDEIAWYYANSNHIPHPVGQKKPNAWGIYDMLGNVAEWCDDDYLEYPNEDLIDPHIVDTRSLKWGIVARGGCWDSFPIACRSACRYFYHPSNQSTGLGFRVAIVPK